MTKNVKKLFLSNIDKNGKMKITESYWYSLSKSLNIPENGWKILKLQIKNANIGKLLNGNLQSFNEYYLNFTEKPHK